MRRIQSALQLGALATPQSQKAIQISSSKCAIPICAACQFGKGQRKPLPGKVKQSHDAETTGNTKKDKLFASDSVALDHFVCSQKGRLFGSAGKTADLSMYSGAAIFVDAATNYIHPEFQTGLWADGTIQAKHHFESTLTDLGVRVQSYQTDKGRISWKIDKKHATLGRGHTPKTPPNVLVLERLLYARLHWLVGEWLVFYG